ncbi:hypothetical protein HPB50_006675 [Hyalomma asiaticum]|uniref:Uncharacterized protein n=1 Tax=Hyalomma asiaticum TaxID=266040 RepID=A0ACB7RJL4_HYAAI|nr:hypothetical protein HPB50_006675 [Hyalomma asiaticum]
MRLSDAVLFVRCTHVTRAGLRLCHSIGKRVRYFCMPASGPGQGSPWSASRPTESVPLQSFFRNGVGSLPVALVPTDVGAIRLSESELFQQDLRKITGRYLDIEEVRRFGKTGGGDVPRRLTYAETVSRPIDGNFGSADNLNWAVAYAANRAGTVPVDLSDSTDHAASANNAAHKQAEDLEIGKCSEVHRQKLARLLQRRRPERETFKAVHNLSSRDLSDNHISLLSTGLNFAIAPRTSNQITPSSSSFPLTRAKGTVVLDRGEYEEKMYNILNDPLHFVKLNRDPTAKSERQLIEQLRTLRNKGSLDQTLYRRLFPSDGATPKIYGLSKVHKDGCPLRPIVSFIGSPTYNLAKFLVGLLRPLTEDCTSGRCSMSTWGAMSKDCLGPLVRLEWPITASRYCDVITRHLVAYALDGPFRDGCYIFQHDRSPVPK